MVELSLFSSVGDADLFASFTSRDPTFENHTFHSANAGADVLRISPSDPHFCALLPCTLYVGVLGWGQDTSFTLQAQQDIDAPSRLFDGRAQHIEAEAETWRYFKFSVGENATEFQVSVTPSLGDPDLYISSDGVLPSRTHFGWHADAAGEDIVTVDAHDSGWCASCSDRHDEEAACSSCDYIIGVHAAQGAAAYGVTAATATSMVILENGVPHAGAAAAGEAKYYRLYLPAGGATGLRVTLTSFSGDATMFMSTWLSGNTRPNTTDHTWSSFAAGAATATVVVPYDDEAVVACLQFSSQCVLYLAIASQRGAAFTVLANLEVVDMGLAVLSPPTLQRSYVMVPAAFGPYAPLQGMQAELALAEPYEACTALVGSVDGVADSDVVVDLFLGPNCAGKQRRVTKADFAGGNHDSGWDACGGTWDDGSLMSYQSEARTWWGSFRVAAGHYAVDTGDSCHDDFDYGDQVPREAGVTSEAGCVSPSYDFNYVSLASAAAVSGKVALVGRGTCSFVEKALHAQRAGAVAMVVVNSVPDTAVAMGAAFSADASQVAIPCVMVLEDDGAQLKQTIEAGTPVRLGLYNPTQRPTLLRSGYPQDGVAAPNSAAHYLLHVAHAHAVTLSLTPLASVDVDLYVRVGGGMPATPADFDFAAADTLSAGGDAVRLDAQLGARFLGTGEYQISVVNPSAAEATYTLVASVDETPTLLRSGNPLFGRASLGQPAFFQFEQVQEGLALQLLLTGFAGDPDLCLTRNASALADVPRRPTGDTSYDMDAAMLRFVSHLEEACTWYSGLLGTDVITVSETDAHGGAGACPSLHRPHPHLHLLRP